MMTIPESSLVEMGRLHGEGVRDTNGYYYLKNDWSDNWINHKRTSEERYQVMSCIFL